MAQDAAYYREYYRRRKEAAGGAVRDTNRTRRAEGKPEIPKRVIKLLNTYRHFDKTWKLDNDLDFDWFMENIEGKPCSHCGCGGPMGADRRDNHRGHTKDNCQPSCLPCNSKVGARWGAEEARRRVCNTTGVLAVCQ